MSCMLRIGGKNFDVDAFINVTKFKTVKKSYKGQPKYRSKPEGEKLSHSAVGVVVSEADFDNLTKQIADTKRFLKRHRERLAHIATTRGIDYAVLDFGIELRIGSNDVWTQSDTFPSRSTETCR